MNLESLIVPLILDTSKYTGELTKAQDSTNKFSQAGDKLTGLGTKFTTGASIPIIGALTGMVIATDDWTDTVDSLGDVLGTSADDSAALAVAIQTVGGDTQTLTGQMAFLTKGLEDGKGGLGKTGEALKGLGISFQDANGQMLPATDILTSVADKLAVMPDGLEKTKLMTELFGKSGKDLSDTMNALANGGFEAAKIKAGELGLTMGDEGVAKTIEMDKAMNTLKLGTQGLAVSLGTTLIPMITEVVNWLITGLKWFNNLSPGVKQTIVVVAALVAGIGPLVTIIGTLSTVIGAIMPVIGGIIAILGGPLLIPIALVVGAIVALALAWKNNWFGIRDVAGTVIEWLKTKFEWFINQFSLIFKAFSLAFKGDWEGFGKTLRTVWDNSWTALKTAFTKAWDGLRDIHWAQLGIDIIKGIANGISSSTGVIASAAKQAAKAALAAAKAFLGIKSPSTVFKAQVGMEMAAGQIAGYEDGLKRFKPRLNMKINSFESMNPVFVNFQYSPMMSFADELEVQTKLKPFIQNVIRGG